MGEKLFKSTCETCRKDCRFTGHLKKFTLELAQVKSHTYAKPWEAGKLQWNVKIEQAYNNPHRWKAIFLQNMWERVCSTLIVHMRRAHAAGKDTLMRLICQSTQNWIQAKSLEFAKYVGDNWVIVVHGQNTTENTENIHCILFDKAQKMPFKQVALYLQNMWEMIQV